MQNFVFRNPTKLIFGKGQLEQLKLKFHSSVKSSSRIRGGSIKRNGIYDNVISILKDINAEVFELTGVEPNPRVSTVKKGIQICKENGVEFILAVGGGSVIDCTKAIAAGSKYDGDVWDIVTKKHFLMRHYHLVLYLLLQQQDLK